MNTTLQTFLSSIHALYQLEPKNLPMPILKEMLKMSPEELFKTCTQLAVLKHNIPNEHKPITLSEKEILNLAESYLRDIILFLKTHTL